MTKCPICGREIEKEGSRCCTACAIKHDAIRRGEGGIHWDYTIPLVKNTVLWRDLVLALGLPLIVIAIIVVLFSNASDRIGVLMLFGVLFLTFLSIAFIVMVAVSRSLGGGLAARFYVNNAGIGYEAGGPAKKISHGTLALSLMSGSIYAAGISLIAISQEESFISWQDVRSVKIYDHQRVILIRSKELGSPIALYCTPENFGRITDMIAKKVPLSVIKT